MEATNSLLKHIFILVVLSLLLTLVRSKSIHLDSDDCGVIIVNDASNKESRSLSLSEMSGKNLSIFIAQYMHQTITSITVKPGRLFRLCATNYCETYDENGKTIHDKLQDIDNDTISAECYPMKEKVTKNTSCSGLTSELQKTNECVRFYRSESCYGILPYEIGKENEAISFNDEIFESLAVRADCTVSITEVKGVINIPSHDTTKQDNLLSSLYEKFTYPHPKGIRFTCTC